MIEYDLRICDFVICFSRSQLFVDMILFLEHGRELDKTLAYGSDPPYEGHRDLIL